MYEVLEYSTNVVRYDAYLGRQRNSRRLINVGFFGMSKFVLPLSTMLTYVAAFTNGLMVAIYTYMTDTMIILLVKYKVVSKGVPMYSYCDTPHVSDFGRVPGSAT